jgi:hypothetical protein
MRKLRNWISLIAVTSVLTVSTTFANTGIIVLGAADQQETKTPCTETTEKVDSGIIVLGATGIIVLGLTGIIVLGAAEEPTAECGIIVLG